jgi:hypothetical protein
VLQGSFNAIRDRLFVGPVVETLVYSKVPATVRAWVDDICNSWDFKQVIPCHFDGPVPATPADFRQAFAFAYNTTGGVEEEGGFFAWLASLFGRKPEPKRKQVRGIHLLKEQPSCATPCH